MLYVLLNGSLLLEDQARIPVTDRGFLLGDGAFITMKVMNGRIEAFSRHISRLYAYCQGLQIFPPKIDLGGIQELISKNNADAGTWRLKIVVSGGNSPLLNLSPRSYGQCLVALKPYKNSKPETRLTLYPQVIQRPSSYFKTLSYLDRLFVAQYALDQGFDDALVLDANGHILEASFSNIFWRIDKTLFVIHSDLPFLDGVYLELIQQAARSMGMLIERVRESVESIPLNAHFFLCNSLKGISPVIALKHNELKRDIDFEKQLNEHVSRLLFE
jgi:4-amino-4-deoxychorismate lyase